MMMTPLMSGAPSSVELGLEHLIDDRDGGLLEAELEDVLNDVVAKGVLD